MSGSKFSTSRGTVIYVSDFLQRVRARTRCATSSRWPARRTRTPTSPGTSSSAAPTSSWPTSGATWSTGRSRWRTRTSGRSRSRSRPPTPTPSCSRRPGPASTPSATLLGRNRFKQAIGEAMRVVAAANRYLSDQEPWKRKDDPDRRDTILHTALQVVQDANTLLTPFLPHAAQQVHEALGGAGVWAAQPEIREVDELGDGPAYPVLTGDYAGEQARWERPRRSRSAARWPSRRRSSPSSTPSSARPARAGPRSRDDGRRSARPRRRGCVPGPSGRRGRAALISGLSPIFPFHLNVAKDRF